MQKVELKKGFTLYGYEEYKPDDIMILYSFTPKPTELKNSAFGFAFGFMWQAYVDGKEHSEVRHCYSDKFFLSQKEKEEMFEVVTQSAIRYFDELFKLRHKQFYETGN